VSLFQGPNGDVSSKRLFGIASLIVAIVVTFTSGDAVQTGIWLGSAAAVFGIQAVTKT